MNMTLKRNVSIHPKRTAHWLRKLLADLSADLQLDVVLKVVGVGAVAELAVGTSMELAAGKDAAPRTVHTKAPAGLRLSEWLK